MSGERDHIEQTERILARYRPLEPTPELRARILREAASPRSRWAIAGWASIAAMLVLTVGLHWAARRLTQQTLASLSRPVQWTAQAEEAAQMLDGQGAGRHYLALALAAGRARERTLQAADAAMDFSEELR